MTPNEFLRGASGYVARTPWPPLRAVGATILIFIVAQVLALVLFRVAGVTGHWGPATPRGGADEGATSILMLWMLVVQIVMAGLVLSASTLFGGRIRDVLQLHPVEGGALTIVYAVLGMIALLGPFNLVVSWLKPDEMLADLQTYAGFLRSDMWWVGALVIGAGAPVMEELTFRGFLLSALAQSRLGFLTAALISTLAWTLLHLGYSAAGMIEVFLIGLYFSWLTWRTGSVWPALFCHALYNSALVLFLRFAPIPI
jgi:hypothetical protein